MDDLDQTAYEIALEWVKDACRAAAVKGEYAGKPEREWTIMRDRMTVRLAKATMVPNGERRRRTIELVRQYFSNDQILDRLAEFPAALPLLAGLIVRTETAEAELEALRATPTRKKRFEVHEQWPHRVMGSFDTYGEAEQFMRTANLSVPIIVENKL